MVKLSSVPATYKRVPGIRAKVVEYFKTYPGERLYLEDIARDIGESDRRKVAVCIGGIRHDRVLNIVRISQGVYKYSGRKQRSDKGIPKVKKERKETTSAKDRILEPTLFEVIAPSQSFESTYLAQGDNGKYYLVKEL